MLNRAHQIFVLTKPSEVRRTGGTLNGTRQSQRAKKMVRGLPFNKNYISQHVRPPSGGLFLSLLLFYNEPLRAFLPDFSNFLFLSTKSGSFFAPVLAFLLVHILPRQETRKHRTIRRVALANDFACLCIHKHLRIGKGIALIIFIKFFERRLCAGSLQAIHSPHRLDIIENAAVICILSPIRDMSPAHNKAHNLG